GLGCCALLVHDDRQAARYLKIAAAADPNLAEAHAKLGQIFASHGEWRAARTGVQKWTRLRPWPGAGHIRLAEAPIAPGGRAGVESDYASALSLAEAGVNYELRKISADPTVADQVVAGAPTGVTYAFGAGKYRVYCMNKDGSTPWTVPNYLYVVSTGTLNGV